MTRGRRVALYLFLLVLTLAAARDVVRLGDDLPWRKMYDFQDFYCAGEAIDRGRSPYLYEPLHDCEQRVAAGTPVFAQHPALVIPAPQPPYDFLPFAALARLDFSSARTAYALALGLVTLVAALALARTGIPLEVAAIALVLPVGYLELNAGQVVPFAFFFLALCGAALAAKRDALAGICAALTTIEPHLGLGVALAALAFVPRARVAVVTSGVLLAAAGVAAVGPATAVAYVAGVLPAHALSELVFPYQYSLTYAARYVGASPEVAVVLGDASFVAFLLAGLWLAPRLARTLRRRELLAFVPAACAVMAGPFLHAEEICFALPAALVFATALRGNAKNLAAATVCILMVPWVAVWATKKLFLASVLACILVLLRLALPSGFIAVFSAVLALSIYAIEFRSPNLPLVPRIGPHVPPGGLAELQWRAFTERLATRDFRWFAIKLPTWGALTAILALCVAKVRR